MDRGWYAGPVGWMDAAEDGEFCVAIRSALIRDRTARLFAGCGIVADSDPAAELAESEIKLEALLPLLSAVVGLCRGGGGSAAEPRPRARASRWRRRLWLSRLTAVTIAITPATIRPPKKSASAPPPFLIRSQKPMLSPIASGTGSPALSFGLQATLYEPSSGAVKP